MEPVLGGRDDLVSGPRVRWAGRSRNGARPWRTGRRSRRRSASAMTRGRNGARPWRTGRLLPPAMRPQGPPGAAMEPVLGGRDDARRGLAGIPRSGDGRNGARPWRTGRRPCSSRNASASGGRNGARPWRTGRPVRCPEAISARTKPQWSPSLADGTTRRASLAEYRAAQGPQWSPSLADGTTRSGSQDRPCRR